MIFRQPEIGRGRWSGRQVRGGGAFRIGGGISGSLKNDCCAVCAAVGAFGGDIFGRGISGWLCDF